MRENFSINSYFVSKWYGSAIIKVTISWIYQWLTKVSFLLEEKSQVYWDMQWRSPFQTYSSISCGQCLKSGNHLYVENIDHLHHPPNFLVPFRINTFPLSAPSNHWSVFFFFLFTYFLSECHTNGISYTMWPYEYGFFHIP